MNHANTFVHPWFSSTRHRRHDGCRYPVPNRHWAIATFPIVSIQWRHNERDGVSNHQRLDCLLNCLIRRRSKKTSKLRVTGYVRGIHRSPVISPHKGPVMRKMLPFDDVIMLKRSVRLHSTITNFTSYRKQSYFFPNRTPGHHLSHNRMIPFPVRKSNCSLSFCTWLCNPSTWINTSQILGNDTANMDWLSNALDKWRFKNSFTKKRI